MMAMRMMGGTVQVQGSHAISSMLTGGQDFRQRRAPCHKQDARTHLAYAVRGHRDHGSAFQPFPTIHACLVRPITVGEVVVAANLPCTIVDPAASALRLTSWCGDIYSSSHHSVHLPAPPARLAAFIRPGPLSRRSTGRATTVTSGLKQASFFHQKDL